MLKRIKQLTGIILILFLLIALLIAILMIWDVINNEIAKEALIKTTYTFSAVYIFSLLILYITKSKK